jgi:hypothetical protein
MSQLVVALALVCGLLFLMLFLMETGRRAGVRRLKSDPESVKTGRGTIDGAVFGLMGLLIAFTFSGAAERFDNHRHMIVQEANDIGTAYLRLDLLPAKAQTALRDDFRNYLDSRIAFYRNWNLNPDRAQGELQHSNALRKSIWTEAVAGCEEAGSTATTSLVLSALNDMFDMTTKRSFAFEDHPPAIVFWGLGILVLASALLAGFGMAEAKRPSRLHMIVFSAILSVSVYVILDLEYPHAGLIRIDKADHVLSDVRSGMK